VHVKRLLRIGILSSHTHHGQEKDVVLYDTLDVLLRDFPEKDLIEPYEIYVVVRVLHQLGYFDQGFTDAVPETLFQDIMPTEGDLEHIQSKKLTYVEYINKCIHDSQF